MNSEILQTLQEIRGILYILTTIAGVVVFVFVVRNITRAYFHCKSIVENSFINQANDYFEVANYKKVIEISENRLKKISNCSNATWWLARANQELNQDDEAQKLFERLLELEPSWKESHIEPYLSKLSN